MKHSIFGFGSVAAMAMLLACGGISDPSRSGENVAVIQGALTASGTVNVPANARVAIIWSDHSTGKLAIGADAPVVNGKFLFKLTVPPTPFSVGGEGGFAVGSPTIVTETPASEMPEEGSAPTPESIRPLADEVGGSITGDLRAAVGGFVVYVDDNGNGKLDLDDDKGTYASSPDKVIGGSTDFDLIYLTGGGAVDYEKLRDETGVKPVAGFNLHLSNLGYWLSTNDVSLKIGPNKLSPFVCAGISDVQLGDPPVTDDPDKSSSNNDPSGSDTDGTQDIARIDCSSDGRTYWISTNAPCDDTGNSEAPAAEGLCSSEQSQGSCTEARYPGGSLEPGEPVPADWPCPVADDDSPNPSYKDAGAE